MLQHTVWCCSDLSVGTEHSWRVVCSPTSLTEQHMQATRGKCLNALPGLAALSWSRWACCKALLGVAQTGLWTACCTLRVVCSPTSLSEQHIQVVRE
jgi:hypothetical protein